MTTADYCLKIIVLGASSSGKSSIIRRYYNDVFDPAQKTTLGFDFVKKKIQTNGKLIELQIWDTAGQDQFSALTRMYYQDTHGVILTYDITSSKSFERVKFWLNDIETNGNKTEQKILIGNKQDLEEERQVSMIDAKIFAEENKLKWLECSAKSGKGINDIFEILANQIIDQYNSNSRIRTLDSRNTCIYIGDKEVQRNSIKLTQKAINMSNKNKGKCC